jgi:hypothetical protein
MEEVSSMRSPALAIAWEIWAARRAGFLAVFLALSCCALLFHVFADALRRSEVLRGASLLPMAASLFLLFFLFNYTENDARGKRFGFPARLFTLPARTVFLVSCPLFYAVGSVVVVYVVWARVVYPPLGLTLPVAWPALFLAAGMAGYLGILWGLAGYRFSRVIALSVFGTTLLMVAFLASLPEAKSAFPWLSEEVLAAGLVAVIVCSYAGALLGVGVQRHGGGRGWAGWQRAWQRLADALPRRRRPFASAAGAQFWYEWRLNGLYLPGCVGFIQVGVIGPLLCAWGTSPGFALATACWGLLLPVLLAVLVGQMTARLDFRVGRDSIPTFLATRPVSSGDLVLTKLRVAGLSVAVSWLLVLTLTPLWLVLWADTTPLAEMWRRFREHSPPLFPWVLVAFVLLLAVAFTWKRMVGNLYLQLSGRLWNSLLNAVGPLFLVACGIAGLVVVENWSSAGGEEMRRQALRWAGWGFQQVPWFAWILNGLFVGKVWFAVWSWRRCWRRGLVSARAAGTFLGLWLAGSLCLVALAHTLFALVRSSPASSGYELPAHVGWVEYCCLLGLLLFLPLARLGLAPSALASYRHR